MKSASPAEVKSKRRRSQRFPHVVSILLSSSDPDQQFHETCRTSEVSAHGCQVQTQRKLTPGQVLEVKVADSPQPNQARVVRVGPDVSTLTWQVGLELLEPGNIWGIEFQPHTLQWPTDLPAPPIPPRGKPATPLPVTPPEAGPRPRTDERAQQAGEPRGETSEERLYEILQEVTTQLTKNVQFALNTAEESIRELSETARQEMQEWFAAERENWKAEMRRAESPLMGESLEQLRRHNEQILQQELERLRTNFREALQAFLERLGKER